MLIDIDLLKKVASPNSIRK